MTHNSRLFVSLSWSRCSTLDFCMLFQSFVFIWTIPGLLCFSFAFYVRLRANKNCRCQDSKHRPLGSEVTTLPTVSQSLSYILSFFVCFVLLLWLFFFLSAVSVFLLSYAWYTYFFFSSFLCFSLLFCFYLLVCFYLLFLSLSLLFCVLAIFKDGLAVPRWLVSAINTLVTLKLITSFSYNFSP